MLDDSNVLKQRDPSNILESTIIQPGQLGQKFEVLNSSNNNDIAIKNVVVASMGGSALAVSVVKTWLRSELSVPVEIVRTYDLPAYVNTESLMIAVSYSGGTEEVISCLNQATDKEAHRAVIAGGGKLIEMARDNLTHIILPNVVQPRMAVINNICAILAILIDFKLVSGDKMSEITSKAEWLQSEANKWAPNIPTEQNYAKQLAMQAEGKTAIFYGGSISGPVANKWKISWNENAKNLSFWNELPEFCHNELSGWTSHPIEKPFAVFDILSNFDHQQILKRFEITDRLLSGQRPKSIEVKLVGESIIEELLWGCILGDFVGVYLGILNNVDPTALPQVDRLKQELVQ